jgi:hypothetical protein
LPSIEIFATADADSMKSIIDRLESNWKFKKEISQMSTFGKIFNFSKLHKPGSERGALLFPALT